MSVTDAPGVPGHAASLNDAGTDTSGGGIERVNAFDGLFLRAEHLRVIEDYSRGLTSALGVAVGSGTVEGYGVAVRNGTLVVQPGLAVDG